MSFLGVFRIWPDACFLFLTLRQLRHGKSDDVTAFRIDRGGAVMAGAVVLLGVIAMHGHLGAGLLLGWLTVVSLLLHECGHMLAARTLGVPVREVGLCLKGPYIRRAPGRTPLDDAAIALSGPTVNALLAAALWSVAGVGHWLAIYNLVLMASNLAPLPGSDGQRIFAAFSKHAADPRIPVAIKKNN